jgi:DNA-binding protein HU-beta
MVKSVKKHGTFNHLGLMKLTLVKKPAVAGGKLVRNPFTGEMIRQKPRPASRTVRVRPLKAIKDML